MNAEALAIMFAAMTYCVCQLDGLEKKENEKTARTILIIWVCLGLWAFLTACFWQ